jgi:hypothetical protein
VAVAIVWLVSWASFFACVPIGNLRTSLLKRIPARGQPLIDALERYHAAVGAYPADLQALIPDYIAEIPPTRLLICPEFHYKRAAPEDEFTGYELSIRTQGWDYDVVFYWPDENYSASRRGQKAERYGNWAHYVFE